MSRLVFIGILCGLLLSVKGVSQTAASGYSYYHPSKDKESWQRLNLWLSASFIVVILEGQADMNSCLYTVSRSLGLSRYAVLAEGFGDADLARQSQWIDHNNPGVALRLLPQTTGRKHLQLLTLLGAYYVFEPDSYRRYRDSAEYFLTQAVMESKALKDDQTGRQALCLLGKLYTGVNDAKGDSIFNQLINQCRKAGDKEMEARAFAWRGRYKAPARTTLQPKLNDLQQATTLYHQLGNTEAEINILTDAGYMLEVTGQLQAAHDSFSKALTLAKAIHYPYIHYITEALSTITWFQGKFGEPLRYSLQTIKVAENTRDSIGWGYFYARLAMLYKSEGRQAEAFLMAQKSVQKFLTEHNPTLYNPLDIVLSQMAEEGRAKEALDLVLDISKKVGISPYTADQFFYYATLSAAWLNAGKPDSASIYAQKMDSLETIAEAVRGPFRRTAVNDQYAAILFAKGQYRQAKALFEKHFTTPSTSDRDISSDINVYYWLLSIDSALNDNASAVAHYKKYTQLLDSNFRIKRVRQAEELQVMYETQEKENQIALLNKQTALVKDNLKKTTLVKDLTLAGIAAVVIIAGLLYRQNRLKQKNNKVITHQNEQLHQLLTDKEWLLKEVHHRVKNNLQIVMSLLNSQSVYINNDAALTAIQDSKRRVYAMSLIHQKLYQSKNIAAIAMPEYIHELVTYIQDSFNIKRKIVIEQQIAPLHLDVSQAIPLGLIINESTVNTIKYAFPDSRHGTMHISLQHDGPDHLLLRISDNGIGLPVASVSRKNNSLGLDLIRGLAKQLKGHIDIMSDNGLHITIRFAVLSKQISEEAILNQQAL